MMTAQGKPKLLVWTVVLATGALGLLGWLLLSGRSGSTPVERSQAASERRLPARAALGPAPALDHTAPERAAEAVAQALRAAPDRLSTTAALPPFDRAAFAANPRQYLARVEPARCFQTAAPGRDVVALQTAVPARAAVTRGVDHPLWVKTAPGAPVTFTAFDGGAFKENGLPSVTVQANANGLAVARFTAPRGVDGDLNIVAGSPLAAGVQRFFLRVVDPE
jgi:hypothetical protein